MDRERGRSPGARLPPAVAGGFLDLSFTGFQTHAAQMPTLAAMGSQPMPGQPGFTISGRRSGSMGHALSRYSSGGEALFAESESLRQPMAVAELIAAIDQGTQSTRVYLFDTNFQPVASHQTTFTQIQPQAGWCEHDPLEVWASVQECLIKAHQAAEEKMGPAIRIVAMGLTNQRETTVVWNRVSGQPLYNAIVWLDNRTGPICEEMVEKLGSKDYFRPVTGLPISTYFSAFKWKWLYDNVDHVRHAVDAGDAVFGTMDSWLIYQLTGGCRDGVHVTDVTNAARTMMMNLETCDWHREYLPLFSMPIEALPTIRSNAEVYGFVSYPQHPAYVGVPISGCLGDQMSAVLGQRCQAGEAKNTYGTGCFTLLNTGEKIVPSTNGLLTTVSYKLGADEPTNYALEGAVAVAGLGISWLKDNLCVIGGPEEAETLAATVADTAGVYFVPAFSGLLAPHWDATARGAILGLTAFSTRAHVVRALLEAICWQTKEVLDAMRRDAKMDGSISVLRVDGGASRNNLLMQMQADFLQTQVLRPQFQETTCLGACLAAGLGAGIWTHAQVFGSQSYNNVQFQPSMSTEEMERRFGKWQTAISRSRELAALHDELSVPAKQVR